MNRKRVKKKKKILFEIDSNNCFNLIIETKRRNDLFFTQLI